MHEDLSKLDQLCIRRPIKACSGNIVDFHGFADAFKNAYAAVLYVRVLDQDAARVTLLDAKTKIAPLKTLLIPRF